jgi:folate-binding protein YgfZ
MALNCEFTTLPGEGLLHISGPDTLGFLQGQTTCDTRRLDASTAIPGAYCTPQGRVVCDFLLLQLGQEHVGLRMRSDILDASAATFSKYIVFSKAEIDRQPGDWQVAACWGQDASEVIAALCGSAPGKPFGVAAANGLRAVQLDDDGQLFECYLDPSVSAQIPAELAALQSEGGEARWRAQQIAAGIGRIEEATIEAFIPQMLNFDVTGHISFDKGCYTGQEVIARLHYRGKSKRRMYLATLEHDAEAGAELYASTSGQSVGSVVNCAPMSGGFSALVVATADGAGAGLHLASQDGPPLSLGELPYPVEA